MKYTAIFLCVCLTGCEGCSNAEERDRRTVDAQQKQYAAAQPIPTFDWSMERDTAIQLYKIRNQAVRTWTVWRSNTGMIEGHCESIGYPLPYDVQLTNPLQPVRQSAVIEQAEPNGLFSSKHTSATWVRQVIKHNGKVETVPLYIEGRVTCYLYPIMVDYEKNRVRPAEVATPSAVLERKK